MQPNEHRPRSADGAPNNKNERRRQFLVRQLTGRRGPAPGVAEERRDSPERRRHSPWSFMYGGFRPRRRLSRRTADHARVFLDWHEPRVLYLALGILLMSCADALFTLNLLAVGGEELNAVMRSLLRDDIGDFLAAKIGLTAVSVVWLVIAVHREVLGAVRVLTLLKLFCLGYVVLIGYELYLLGWQATGAADELLRELLSSVAVALA